MSLLPFTLASDFIILRNTLGNYLKSSIFRYSCSTANISKHGKTNRQTSLNVRTFKIDSKSKMKSSRSLRLEYKDVGLPSSSVSESLKSAVSNDYLGVSPSYPNLSSSSLSLKLSMSSFIAGDCLSVNLLLESDAFSF